MRCFPSTPASAGTTAAKCAVRLPSYFNPRTGGDHLSPSPGALPDFAAFLQPPRLRGPPPPPAAASAISASTPALVGTTTPRLPFTSASTFNPRACGDHVGRAGPIALYPLQPPRLRGPRPGEIMLLLVVPSTPALAGTTTYSKRRMFACPFNPRACGDHAAPPIDSTELILQPPRLRGPLVDRDDHLPLDPSTPALAGTTPCRCGQSPPQAFNPRACGDHDQIDLLGDWQYLQPPRLRGPLRLSSRSRGVLPSTPALAGTTTRTMLSDLFESFNPRACGDHVRC